MTNYQGRITSVLHYINQQVRKDWTGIKKDGFNQATKLETLCLIANMSKRNFQLYFKSYLNETFRVYINRIRLEYAQQFLQDQSSLNADIAERIGFANDPAFYNAFKNKYKITPSEYQAQSKFEYKKPMKQIESRVEFLKAMDVIFISYIGDYDNLSGANFEEESWNKLYDYAVLEMLLPEKEDYWGICFDNTEITASNKCRFYACLRVNQQVKTKADEEIKYMNIPSSQYAIFTHNGPYEALNEFYDLAIQNIPKGYQLSDALILEHYINSPTEVSIDYLITEVWIPITVD